MAPSKTNGGPAGRVILTLGVITFLHAAYSTYEYFSIRKSLGLPNDSVPGNITIEMLFSLLLLLVGISLTAAPLKRIAWSSEMRTRTIDQVDARSSFASLDHRGPILFNNAATLLEKKYPGH
ncbi:hypothetical protein K437DRAFT_237149 [Tilletiaria anomala UBC 951]|uniref:Membrane magnesium transporter n=1 Tax=Tilletiaria anomala (strain ATCC 24038 / CBS 436.72 / UBC 951) TaxID=1037660 RepID=A0A066VYE5_TILAU|nr:uncharacterized protein K437DRAFT_237149 [Tilletiaria anomala UBC 951]KDN43565.1 hypothetical protein K437DRAFT_237149 [Tilletiaria anomala UBC 951]